MVYDDDCLKFTKYVADIVPALESMVELMRGDRISLQNNKFQMENNHRTIQEQQAQISQNQVLLDEAKNKAGGIIAVAEERVKEIEKSLQSRIIHTNQMEKEAKKKLDLAEKALFDSRTKKPVEA